MKIDVLTLFPEMFSIFEHSIIGRAVKNNSVNIATHNIRDFSKDKHKKVDDYPYGGGAGMVMTPQPLVDAINFVKSKNSGKVIFLGPRGRKFSHNIAESFSKEKELIFLCGHYEGIDERVYNYIDDELSLGDFILTGGEMACIPIIDSICRLIPGVLGKSESFMEESFYDGLLEYPQYTRPEIFEDMQVPKMLLSGHHENIKKWRKEQSFKLTSERRPDLIKEYSIKQKVNNKSIKK